MLGIADADHFWTLILAIMITTLVQPDHIDSVAGYDPEEPVRLTVLTSEEPAIAVARGLQLKARPDM